MPSYDFIRNFLGKVNNPTRNAFDLSQSHAFSSHAGLIQPVCAIPTIPGEHYNVKVNSKVETSPMIQNNFVQINETYKAVFVPFSSISPSIDMSVLPRNVRENPLFSDLYLLSTFNLNDLLIVLFNHYFVYYYYQKLSSWYQTFSESSDPNELSLSVDNQEYGYLVKYMFNQGSSSSSYTQLSSVSFTRVESILELLDQYLHLYDQSLYAEYISNVPWVVSALRLLDQLGYGNYFPVFEAECQVFNGLLRDSVNSVSRLVSSGCIMSLVFPDSVLSSVSLSFGYGLMNPGNALLQQLTFFDSTPMYRLGLIEEKDDRLVVVERSVTLIPLMCWSQYILCFEKSNYRQPSYDYLSLESLAYNNAIDLNFTDSSISSGFRLIVSGSSLTYNIYDLDVFTYLNTYDELGDLRTPTAFLVYLLRPSYALLEQDLYTSSQLSVVHGSVPTVTQQNLTSNLIKSINDVSALYKLREDALRAGVRRDAVYRAIYGVAPNTDASIYPRLLGASSKPLTTVPVVSQSSTESAPLGALASRGFSNDGGLSFDFNSTEFGVLFIVQCFKPRFLYEAFQLDYLTVTSPEDYFKPHYNHLGLQPIYSRDISIIRNSYTGSDISDAQPIRNDASVVGFTSRYFHLKTAVDKAHGLFSNYGVGHISAYSNRRSHRHFNLYESLRSQLPFSGYVSTAIESQVNVFSQGRDLYIRPYMLNGIFDVYVNSHQNSDLSFDQFKSYVHCEIHKVSPMAKIGLFQKFTGN